MILHDRWLKDFFECIAHGLYWRNGDPSELGQHRRMIGRHFESLLQCRLCLVFSAVF